MGGGCSPQVPWVRALPRRSSKACQAPEPAGVLMNNGGGVTPCSSESGPDNLLRHKRLALRSSAWYWVVAVAVATWSVP
jgi:hypothetical protein